MQKFNWNKDWWIDGMSMMCFAHHFCRANALSFPQFRRAFDTGWPTPNTLYLNSRVESSFDFERLFAGCDLDVANAKRLFPSTFAVTDTQEQYSDSLRYCSKCVDQGIHLAVHQLEWMVCCPVHLEPIQTACTCGARIPYTLTNKSKTSEALCKCDELRFGDFLPFDEEEREGLDAAFKTIEQLSQALQFGFNQYRVSVGEANNEELREQVNLTERIILTILSDDQRPVLENDLRCCSIQFPCQKPQARLNDRFAGFIRWAKGKSDDKPELWSAALIAQVVEEEYFDAQGQQRIELAIEDNGGRSRRKEWDVPMVVDLLSVRLLEGLARGHRPVGCSLKPDIRLAFRMYGEPLCQIIWHDSPSRTRGTAYWLGLGVGAEDHGVPWIRSLAEFLVAMRFNRRLSSSRFAKLRQPHTLASFDQIFGGYAASTGPRQAQQLPLFDWL